MSMDVDEAVRTHSKGTEETAQPGDEAGIPDEVSQPESWS